MAARTDHLARLPHGPLIIKCQGGQELETIADIICIISPVLADAVALMEQERSESSRLKEAKRAMKVLEINDTTVEQWQIIMRQVYPAINNPPLTLREIADILPVVHKYNISVVQGRNDKRLESCLFSDFSPVPESERYVLKWLQMAETLQLDKLKEACLKVFKTPGFGYLAVSGKLDNDLKALSTDTLIQAVKSMADTSRRPGIGASKDSSDEDTTDDEDDSDDE